MGQYSQEFLRVLQGVKSYNLKAEVPDMNVMPVDERPDELYIATFELTDAFLRFSEEQLDVLGLMSLRALINAFNVVNQQVGSVAHFQRSNDFKSQQDVHERLRTAYEAAAALSGLPLAILAMRNINFSQTTKYIKDISDYHQQAAELFQKQRTLVTDQTVGIHSQIFGEVSKSHSAAAIAWLVTLLFATGVTLCIVKHSGTWFAIAATDTQFTPAVMQTLISRVVVVSIAYYAAIICLKNYRINRHLAVVNDQKRNALRTFELFAAAAKDEVTKNAVLLETTRAIFTGASSGYLGSEEPDPSPARLIEVLKLGKGGP